MRQRLVIATLRIAILLAVLGGCAETVRCPEGQVFGDDGRCEPITRRDGGAGNSDGG